MTNPAIKEAYKRDFLEILLSSKRKILKAIAVLFIPFVYAFICIAALWNPLGNIGKLPMAIVSLDKGYSDGSNPIVYGIDTFMNDWRSGQDQALIDMGLTYNDSAHKYCARVSDQFTFTNIDYISATDQNATYTNPLDYMNDNDDRTNPTGNVKWDINISKYYLEVGIPTCFSEFTNTINFNKLEKSICSYIAYERNYVTCEILDMGCSFILGGILQNIISDLLPNLDIDNLIFHDVPNKKFALYGVGIGELFLCVGMWVGAFAFVLIYDRKKRVANMSNKKWYFSKWLMMISISLIQSVVVMLAVGSLGLFGLGGAFLLDWMLIAFGGIVFSTIIQSLWFTFRDKSIGNFLMIVLLVLNIACGFGTFPALIQFPLFHWLSYIMPFSYMMHAQGALIFNIAVNTNVLSQSLYILQCVGILLIYPIIFFIIGCFNAKRREREIYYGSSIKKDVLDSLCKLKIDKKYVDDKGQLQWNKLPKKQMLDVINLTLINHPYESKFKWFKKRKRFIEEDLSKISE